MMYRRARIVRSTRYPSTVDWSGVEMSIKPELHRLVDQLSQQHEDSALEYLRWLLADDEALDQRAWDAVREGEAEIDRGDFITVDDFVQSLP